MEEERMLTNNKGITMAQWKSVNRNNAFVNPPRLPFSCEISGALHLAELGLMAGRLSDENLAVYGICNSTFEYIFVIDSVVPIGMASF